MTCQGTTLTQAFAILQKIPVQIWRAGFVLRTNGRQCQCGFADLAGAADEYHFFGKVMLR